MEEIPLFNTSIIKTDYVIRIDYFCNRWFTDVRYPGIIQCQQVRTYWTAG